VTDPYISLEHIIRDMNEASVPVGTVKRREVAGTGRPGKDGGPDAGTEARRGEGIVGRPVKPSDASKAGTVPTQTDTLLYKNAAVKTNVVDEAKRFGSPADFGLPPELISLVKGVVAEAERPEDDVQVAIGKIKGGKGNPVDLKPMTDDRNNDDARQDADSRRARKAANDAIGQPGSSMKEAVVDETLAADHKQIDPVTRVNKKMAGKLQGFSSIISKLTKPASFREGELGELFDEPYASRKVPGSDDGLTKRRFTTDRGNRYDVSVKNDDNHPNLASVAFTSRAQNGVKSHSVPDKSVEPGSAHRVLSTVKDAVGRHIRSNPHVTHLTFSASGREPSKVRLYHHIAKSIDPNYGHDSDSTGEYHHFIVNRPKGLGEETHGAQFDSKNGAAKAISSQASQKSKVLGILKKHSTDVKRVQSANAAKKATKARASAKSARAEARAQKMKASAAAKEQRKADREQKIRDALAAKTAAKSAAKAGQKGATPKPEAQKKTPPSMKQAQRQAASPRRFKDDNVQNDRDRNVKAVLKAVREKRAAKSEGTK
jgi:hypothetical protein